MEITLFHVLIAGSLIAAAGGMLGSFALLRRMALVGDALSHVALPGIALGILWNFNPFLGALAFLVLGTTFIWAIEHRTKLPVDTLVGVLFVSALAAGALLVPNEEELFEALFGEITDISAADFFMVSGVGIGLIAFLALFAKRLSLTMISAELAASTGLNPHLIEFIFLTLFALLVGVGIKFTGILLIGALVIIPAAIARNLASSMKMYLLLSALLGIAGAVAGILVSTFYELTPGPTFVLFLSPLFFLSVFFRKEGR